MAKNNSSNINNPRDTNWFEIILKNKTKLVFLIFLFEWSITSWKWINGGTSITLIDKIYYLINLISLSITAYVCKYFFKSTFVAREDIDLYLRKKKFKRKLEKLFDLSYSIILMILGQIIGWSEFNQQSYYLLLILSFSLTAGLGLIFAFSETLKFGLIYTILLVLIGIPGFYFNMLFTFSNVELWRLIVLIVVFVFLPLYIKIFIPFRGEILILKYIFKRSDIKSIKRCLEWERYYEQFEETPSEEILNSRIQNLDKLGKAYININAYKECIKTYEKALEVGKQLNRYSDYSKEISRFYRAIGNSYNRLKFFETAQKYLSESLKILTFLSEKEPEVYNYDLSLTKISLSYTLINLNYLEEAEKYMNETIKFCNEIYNWFYVKACLESKKNNKTIALDYLKKAIEKRNYFIDYVKSDKCFNCFQESDEDKIFKVIVRYMYPNEFIDKDLKEKRRIAKMSGKTL